MNWKQAFSIGVIALGMWDGKGEPVAYLYNGVRLPKLPESEYKYVLIQQLNSRWFQAFATKEKPYVSDKYLYFPSESMLWDNYYAFDYTYTDDWGAIEGASAGLNQVASSFIWSNTDILNTDGTVYLSASDPIPVYA